MHQASLGDVDGDGEPEILLRDGEDAALYDYDGHDLAELARVQTPAYQDSIGLVDLDGDGRAGLVVSSCEDPATARLLVHERISEGVFEPTQELVGCNVGPTPADVDNDGDTDLVAQDPDGVLVILRNDGSGILTAEEGPRADSPVLAGDLDGDGDLDLVSGQVFDLDGGLVGSTFWNNGAGRFDRVSAAHFCLGGPAVGDADTDGKAEVVCWGRQVWVAGYGADRLFEGTTRLAWVDGMTPSPPILLADLDGDRAPEIVGGLADSADDTEAGMILRNDGSAGIASLASVPGLPLAAGDLDGDNHQDLVISTPASEGSWVRILRNDGAGHLPREGLPSGLRPEAIVAVDLDGRGSPEIVSMNQLTLRIWSRGTADRWDEADFADVYVGTANDDHLEGLAAGDLDGDGDRDLVVASELEGEVWVLWNDGNGLLESEEIAELGREGGPSAGLETAALGDLDGDGSLDLVLARSGGAVIVIRGPDWSPPAEPEIYPVGRGAESLVLVDLDGDGDTDVATANEVDDSVTILANDGHGGLATVSSIPIDAQPESIAAGDLDADGDADLVTVHGLDDTLGPIDTLVVLVNDGGGRFERRASIRTPAEPRAALVADLDADDDLDIAVACAGADAIAVLRNDGAGSFGDAIEIGVGVRPFALAVADLDGVCPADLLVANKGSGDITVLLSSAQ